MGFVTILDEAPSGEKFGTRKLQIAAENFTLRMLIERRIKEEVEEFNRKQSETVFTGFIQPTETERVLNGYRLKARRELSWENQYQKALEAFRKNGFFVIVDGHQVEDLDEVIPLRENSEVHFLKLVPLVGG
jgi:DNA-binding Lrp family transcriptional regulator